MSAHYELDTRECKHTRSMAPRARSTVRLVLLPMRECAVHMVPELFAEVALHAIKHSTTPQHHSLQIRSSILYTTQHHGVDFSDSSLLSSSAIISSQRRNIPLCSRLCHTPRPLPYSYRRSPPGIHMHCALSLSVAPAREARRITTPVTHARPPRPAAQRTAPC